MSSKIVIILNNNSYYCDTIQKIDSNLISCLFKAPTSYPVNVVIYKNGQSNKVHFATNQGRRFWAKDGTKDFYFNEFYNELAKESVKSTANAN